MSRDAIAPATDAEREWAACVMSESDPWLTLGRDVAQCRAFIAPAPDSELLIAHVDGEPAGFLFLRPRGFAGSPYIASIGVAAAHRGRGVGSEMLRHAETRYAPTARHIFLCVSSFNADARRLYERVGYKHVGTLPDYLIDGASELIMHKRLAR